MINNIPEHRLEEIELRLLGADHRPWAVSGFEALDQEGRRTVQRASRKALKKAIQKASKAGEIHTGLNHSDPNINEDEILYDANVIDRELTLLHRTDLTTDDMLEFIAHAPEDIEELLREIKQMHIIATKAKEERHDAVQELQTLKIKADRAERKIIDMRRAWRTLCKEMGTKP